MARSWVAGVTAVGSASDIGVVRLGGPCVPEIHVTGNGVSIPDGDTLRSATDNTDFGSTNVTGGTVVKTFTIQNIGTADLTLSAPNTVGTGASDFQVTASPVSPVLPGNSTTFQVTFDPSSAGLSAATVIIANNDADENPFDFAIQGTGVTTYTVTYDGNGNTGGAAPVDASNHTWRARR